MNETRYIVRFKRADGATPEKQKNITTGPKPMQKCTWTCLKKMTLIFPLMYESIQLIEKKNNKEESILEELKFK